MTVDPYRNVSDAKPVIKELARHLYESTRKSAPSIWIGRGYDKASSEHSTGLALDIIASAKTGQRPTKQEKEAGDLVAAWLIRNADQLHIRHIIWNKQIWRHRRAAEGWQPLPNRNASSSISDWHEDHVHVWLDDTTGIVPKTPLTAIQTPTKRLSFSYLMQSMPPHTGKNGNAAIVQDWLRAKGFYNAKSDGIWGPVSIKAYAKYQESLGYRGKDADGIPGRPSLSKLAADFDYIITD